MGFGKGVEIAAGLIGAGDVTWARDWDWRAQEARVEALLEAKAGDGGGESERAGLLLGLTNWKSFGNAPFRRLGGPGCCKVSAARFTPRPAGVD